MWYTITLAIGIALVLISIFLCRESLSFLKKSERTVGRVTELQKIYDSDGNTYKAVFTFKTKENDEFTFRQNGSSNPSSFEVGEEVNIAYNPKNPWDARVLSYFGVFSWSIVLMAIGMAAIVVGGGYHLAMPLLR